MMKILFLSYNSMVESLIWKEFIAAFVNWRKVKAVSDIQTSYIIQNSCLHIHGGVANWKNESRYIELLRKKTWLVFDIHYVLLKNQKTTINLSTIIPIWMITILVLITFMLHYYIYTVETRISAVVQKLH